MEGHHKKFGLLKLATLAIVSLSLLSSLFFTEISFSKPGSPLVIQDIKAVDQLNEGKAERIDSQHEVIGIPCGSGELMSPDTICLHGRILTSQNGELVPLSHVPVTISFDEKSIQGETFYHAGAGEPAYGIDISSLDPIFFDSISISAEISGSTVTRDVILYPNFDTHNQQYDLIIPGSSAFDDRVLWGHIVDYEAQGPVSGAVITVEYGSPVVQVTTVTAEDPSESYPIYKFGASELPGLSQGETLTLTSEYQSQKTTQVLSLSGEDSQQQNLIIGWFCNDSDPFPGSGGNFFFPGSGGNFFFPGFPNVICIWGYGASNGNLTSDIDIEIEIDGKFFSGNTKLFPGETIPRYGIALPDAEDLINQPITITASLNGLSEQAVISFSSQDSPIKQTNFNIIGAGVLGNSVGANKILDIIWIDQNAILATNGGLVQWDFAAENNEQQIIWTPKNSPLKSFNIEQIRKDSRNNIFTKTDIGDVKHYHRYNPTSQLWEETNLEDQLPENSQFSTNSKDQIWISNHNGFYQLDETTDKWRFFSRFDETASLGEGQILDYAVDSKGGVWFATFAHGFKHYDNQNQEWTIFTNTNSGLPENKLVSIAIGPDDILWIGTEGNGVVKYDTNNQTFQTFTTTNSDLLWDGNPIVTVDSERNLYVVTLNGIQKFDPNSNIWVKLDTSNTNLFDYQLSKVFFSPTGKIWLTSDLGLFRNDDDSSYSHFQITNAGPIGDRNYSVFEAENGNVWFATEQGLSKYDPITGEWSAFTPLNSSIPEFRVWSVASISEGVIWAGLGDHIWQYDENSGQSMTFNYQDIPVAGRFFQALSWSDYCNCLLIGSDNGISQYYPDEDRWKSWEFPDAINEDTAIWQVQQFADGLIWGGTGTEEHVDNGLLILNPENGEWRVVSTEDGLLGNTVTDIARTSDGRIWISQFQAGLSEITIDGEIVQHFTLENSSMPFNSIDDLEVDKYDRIWAATKKGLIMFDPLGNSWEQFVVGEELGGTSPFLFNLSFGRANDLWAASDSGAIHWFMPIEGADLQVNLYGPDEIDYTALTAMQYTLTVTNTGEMAANTDLSIHFPITTTVASSDLPMELEPSKVIPIGVLGPEESATYSFELTPSEGWQPNQLFSVSVETDANGRETLINNNRASVNTRVVQPDQVDLSVELQGPSILSNSGTDELRIMVINSGDKTSPNSQATLIVPGQVSIVDAFPQALNDANSEWRIPPLNLGEQYVINFQIDYPTDGGNGKISLTATISQTIDESYTVNNQATINVPFSVGQIETLILVSPNRLNNQYGSSIILEELYRLAEHSSVNGLVVNLEEESGVGSELTNFDSFPSDWTQANRTAEAIKPLIDNYINQIPTIKNVVLVGGDSIIPHYRVEDENPTEWKERNYAIQVVNNERTFSAMLANKMLTDDFYVAEEPTTPDSFFWNSSSSIYLPDIAIGRLAETPDEIISVVQEYLIRNGRYPLEKALVGGDSLLAGDLVERQCDLLSSAGFVLTCSVSEESFSNAMENSEHDSVWTAFHSNHYGMGLFGSVLEARAFADFNSVVPLMGTIGCHAGLNIQDSGQATDFDFVQATALNGGAMIGSTSYTYGSTWEINYTESLVELYMRGILTADDQSAGELLRIAKQTYYEQRPWFDPLDAKAIMPMTFYGLPMMKFEVPDRVRQAHSPEIPESELVFNGNTVSIEFEDEDFSRRETAEGSIVAYKEQTISQHRLPIQPAHMEPVPLLKDGKKLKGIVFINGQFTDFEEFDPVINETWAMGAQRQLEVVEPILEKASWDREMPAGVILPSEQLQNEATLSYIPGLFNADTQTERLFSEVTLELIYGDNEIVSPSYITDIQAAVTDEKTMIKIGSTGGSADRVIVLYELGTSWVGHELIFDETSGEWMGEIEHEVDRYQVQIVSKMGDVNLSGWLLINQSGSNSIRAFLPVIAR